MADELNFDLNPAAARGASLGARVGLAGYGIEAGEDICNQVALSVLCGFVSHGGLEPESIRRLKALVETATAQSEQKHVL